MFAERFGAVLACANVNPARRTASYTSDGAVISVPLVPRGLTTPPELRKKSPRFTAEMQEILHGSSVSGHSTLAGDPARELELLADRLDAAMIIVGTRGRVLGRCCVNCSTDPLLTGSSFDSTVPSWSCP